MKHRKLWCIAMLTLLIGGGNAASRASATADVLAAYRLPPVEQALAARGISGPVSILI
jgi:hypothetical protein